MAAPTYTGPQVTTDAGNVTSVNATLPGGTIEGDFLVIIAGGDAASAATYTATSYTSEGNAGDGTSQASIGVLYGSVTATNITDGYVTVTQSTSNEMWAALYVIDGSDETIAGSSITSAGATTTHSFGTASGMASDDYLFLAGLSFDGADGDPFTVNAAASDTHWDSATVTDINAGTGSNEAGGCVLEATLTGTSTGTLQVDSSVSDGAAYAVVAIPKVDSSPIVTVGGLAATSAVGSASAAGEGNVTVSGVSATSAVGAVTVEIGTNVNVTVGGVGATSSVGATEASVVWTADADHFTADVENHKADGWHVDGPSVSASGVSATSAVGSVTATADANLTVGGLAATSAVGSVTTIGDANAIVSGVVGTTGVGSVTITGDANFAVSGVVGTTGVGTALGVPTIIIPVSGVVGTTSVGSVTLTAGVDVSISGVSATASAGNAFAIARKVPGQVPNWSTITPGSDSWTEITPTNAPNWGDGSIE